MPTKPSVEKLLDDPGQSFSLRHIIRKQRSDQHKRGVWHYHPEYEITLTLKSSGNRFVGYNMDQYGVYDFVLIGENVPHCWITDEHTEQLVINFKHDVFDGLIEKFPEMQPVNKLLSQSHQGIKFDNKTAVNAFKIMETMGKQMGFSRLLSFLDLLNLMAKAENRKFLSFLDFDLKDSLNASNRIETIYTYILKHYKSENISFTGLSEKLNLSKGALCKFIKRMTKKTFTGLVIETRLNEACKLLSKSDQNIADICFICGFNNLSNFNRAFKRVMQMTPKDYRNLYSGT